MKMRNFIFTTALLLLFFSIVESAKLETFDSQYGLFNETYYDIFEAKEPSSISKGALQVTVDSESSDLNKTNSAGRILLKHRFKLWEGDNLPSPKNATQSDNIVRIASFNTSFLMNIFRPKNETPGEGLTFVIAPDLLVPLNSYGEYLGLTNSSTDGQLSNKIVAIELDTVKQEFDIDDNHIGININSVRSVNSTSLTPYNITLAPTWTTTTSEIDIDDNLIGIRVYNVWVDYDGVDMVIRVYTTEQANKTAPTPPKPSSPILSADLDLRDHVSQYSYFGFSASTGDTYQLNCVLSWNLTVESFPEDLTVESFPEGGNDEWLKILLGVLVPVLVVLLIGGAGFGYCFYKRRVARQTPSLRGALSRLPGMPREFKFKDLKKATNGFDPKHKLGQGGYGVVYRGLLVKEDLEIAVKCFSRESIQGQGDFLAELTIINRLRHKHLVKLLGWCHRNGKLLLIYEYMPNCSLDKHLFADPTTTEPLSWSLRYKITSGLASALHYLHNEYEQRVVHRDLKASNIMLDSNFNARLGDFGLARALDNGKTSYVEAEGVLGTIGYIAPECFLTGKATQQSDVYAFGAVLLELVCGQRPGYKIDGFQLLVDWVWFLHRDGRLLEAVDRRLGKEYVTEEAERLLLLGLACSHPIPSQRPKTQDISQIISGLLEVPDVPPFKPSFVWPAMEPVTQLDSSSASTMSMVTLNLGSGWSYTGHTDSLV